MARHRLRFGDVVCEIAISDNPTPWYPVYAATAFKVLDDGELEAIPMGEQAAKTRERALEQMRDALELRFGVAGEPASG